VHNHFITLMIFIPLLGAFLQVFTPKWRDAFSNVDKWVALSASLLSSFFGLWSVFLLQKHSADVQIVESLNWVGSYSIHYEVGMDGLSAALVILLSILFPVLITAEWKQKTAGRGMFALFLILQSSLIGAVCSQDLFLLFFFWAMSAVPIYFLIGIWGGAKREESAIKTLVTASIGNAFIFAAFLLIYYTIEPHTFLLKDLAGGKLAGKYFLFLGNGLYTPHVAFLLFSVGLSLRLPIWPLHGWFTQLAEEAPASVFSVVCGAAVPVALYLFMRMSYTLFPDALPYMGPSIVNIGILNLLLGIICAFAQRSLALLVAFSCMAEVGLLLIGVGSLNSAGVVGAAYQQLSMGLAVAGLGLFGGIVYDRVGHVLFMKEDRQRTLGGVALSAPRASFLCALLIASLIGLPGFAGFVSHSLLYIGSYSLHPVIVLLSGGLFILTTYYVFSMYRSIFLGQAVQGFSGFVDLSVREQAYLLPVGFALLVLGIYPKPVLELIRPTVLTLLSTLN
jgi:NADH-quinone oxidoreductase subunit M